MITIEATGIPWADIAGGSAVLAVIAVIVLFLKDRGEQRKFDETQRKESHETIRKAHETIICVSDKFAQSVGENTDTFATTIKETLAQAHNSSAVLLHEAREAHAKCEETIHGLLRDAPRLHARKEGIDL